MVPILRPCQVVPSECAASSITGMPRASASAMIASMSRGMAAHVADQDRVDVAVSLASKSAMSMR